ncbi:4Fe-4S single cluster domain-containing protein [Streptomyces aidingensis]|uniref:Anaerobic ribonucleoside-triphosphate reductase activating protein n=1 Tax=Streptomyces aidingensis TaxID=910347 RepID=A0A1I1R2U9_9ACTN|nr:4Fe-4S single cluster domain-containing protein [Streptomyces aidingensis]SFD25853.1 anaerobic ribonucleoside-triphosphate reductase activating protein [Streptomyces aidingensis]
MTVGENADASGAAAELRVSGTHFPVTTLGPGRRLVVWTQGCALACPGCMSRHTWDPDGGRSAPVPALLAQWRSALDAGAQGLTVSGGEPLEQPAALAALLAGAARMRALAGPFPHGEPDLLVYTGYAEAELDAPGHAALRHADAVITGRYRAGRPTRLVWRGSANQRLLPRTPLGRRRYAPHLSRTTAGPSLETVAQGTGVMVHGVPGPGELAALERALRMRGVRLSEPSWRPAARRHRDGTG